MSKVIASAIAINKGQRYATNLVVNEHRFIADELPEYNGQNLGPAPGDYVCAALASCTAITLRMYAERKRWKVDEINVNVKLVKGAEMASGLNTFYCEVKLDGDLTAEQHKRMMEIAKACPVHRMLIKPSDVITIMGE